MSSGRRATPIHRRTGRLAACAAVAVSVLAIPSFVGSTGIAHAAGGLVITEVAAWGSSNSLYGADWFEVTNTTASAVDLTGWKMDDSSASFATGVGLNGISSIAAGESVIFLETSDLATTAANFKSAWFGASTPSGLHIGGYSGSGVGLSTGGDGVTLFDATPSHAIRASVSFGASPSSSPLPSFDNTGGTDGSISALSAVGTNGAFSSVNGTASVGSPGTATVSSPTTTTSAAPTTSAASTTTVAAGATWPGGTTLTPVDLPGLVTQNLSGLTYEGSGSAAPGVLWAVQNSPSTLFKLVFDGTNWVPAVGEWSAGKALKYPDGTGNPDSEGVAMGGPTSASGIFVATERNNDASGVSRNAILRFDPTAAGTTSTATQIWDLTSDLPSNGPNLGLETITWVPDTFLQGNGLVDEATSAPYTPSTYPNHGTGLFVVGVEASGTFSAYALDLGGNTFHRVASFTSGMPGVMASEFDPETGDFWAHCDNTCLNRSTVLHISPTSHHFVVTGTFAAPSDMPTDMNNEGFAITPNSECVGNLKPVYWADDGDTAGNSLRRGSISCSPAPETSVPEFPFILLPSLIAIALFGGSVVLVRRRRPAAAPTRTAG